MPSSYALGETTEGFINGLIEAGRYNSKSEVVRDALRLLEKRELVREIKLEELRHSFREGIESGQGQPASEVFDRLKGKYNALTSD